MEVRFHCVILYQIHLRNASAQKMPLGMLPMLPVSDSNYQWPIGIGYWQHIGDWQHSQPFGGILGDDSSAFALQHALTRETDTVVLPSLRNTTFPTTFEPTATSPNAIPSDGTINLGAAKATEEMKTRKQHRQQETAY